MKKWYNNGIEEIQIKDNQNIPNGYVEGRIRKKSRIDDLILLVSKEELYKVFIIENNSYDKTFEILHISRRDLRLLLTYYKIKKTQKQSAKNNNYVRPSDVVKLVAEKSRKTQKEKWKNKSEEEKKQCSKKRSEQMLNRSDEAKQKAREKYQEYLSNLSQEEKEEINKRRSESCKKAWQREGIREQRHNTYINNMEIQKGKKCRTIAEQKMYDKLKCIYEDVQYDIKVDDRYPYYCDFYIPSLDLFIELQAHPSHGKKPIEFLTVDEYSKYPVKWVDVFARRDVEKNKCAIQNNVKLLRIYPSATLNENYTINQTIDKSLVEICYKTQK